MEHRIPFLSLILAALALGVHALPGASEALQFDRTAIAGGEWWRWLTAHLTHFDANHLAWDVGVLLALGWTCERDSRAQCGAAIALAAIAITPAVFLWQPQFETYRGLSGIDSALFGLLAASLMRRQGRAPRLVGGLALLGIVTKCGIELATGVTVFAQGDAYAPVPLAHLVGTLAGAISAVRFGHSCRQAIANKENGVPELALVGAICHHRSGD